MTADPAERGRTQQDRTQQDRTQQDRTPRDQTQRDRTQRDRTPRGRVPREARQLVERRREARGFPSDHEHRAFESVVADAIRSRERRELADLDVRRSIFKLADEGMSQRRIAELVGLSQPEVSRRLKRRALTSVHPGPRELILRRDAGVLSTREMMDALSDMEITARKPTADAAFDGAVTSRGTAKELSSCFLEGLLTKAEYEKLRSSIRTVPESR